MHCDLAEGPRCIVARSGVVRIQILNQCPHEFICYWSEAKCKTRQFTMSVCATHDVDPLELRLGFFIDVPTFVGLD